MENKRGPAGNHPCNLRQAMAALRNVHNLSERVINSILDLIMGEAIAYFGLHNSQIPQLEGE
ncbi:MAG: hypothetical protein LWX52_14310 [Deltaproteobacteria bacterium]|nr:hypothetical protein [Deltaproteobacteria bacterium]